MDSNHSPDDRTREQHMADVAAAALDNINQLIHLSSVLSRQVNILENRSLEADPSAAFPPKLAVVRGMEFYLMTAREALRDVAATLPIRGIDFGVGVGDAW